MTKAELLAQLTVEQYTSPWWATPAAEPDDDVTTARRRRAMADDYDRADRRTVRRSRGGQNADNGELSPKSGRETVA